MTSPGTSERIAVAMSGGIDSSVAAMLCVEAGYDVFGITMTLDPPGREREGLASSQKNVERAAGVCRSLGVEHRAVDLSEEFWSIVVERFVDEYRKGRTPNPCTECNYHIKFGLLYDHAAGLGAERLATGHYARIREDRDGWSLLRGKDREKDQSYFLYSIVEDPRPRALLPLGDMTKDEGRRRAEDAKLPVADAEDSQDICFMHSRAYTELVAELVPESMRPGDIIEAATGKRLGEHKGISAYTIGQRQGIGVAAREPFFVVGIDPVTNTVYVGSDARLWQKEFTVTGTKCTNVLGIGTRLDLECKVRSTMQSQPSSVLRLDRDACSVEFREPQRAIAPGQAAVFYSGDRVAGGGTIERVYR
jgi:tRNA-specific 2-thiouridylase